MNIGHRLAAAREAREMSQSALARLTGSKQSTISNLENGDIMSIRAEMAAAFARALRVNLLWLITGEGEMYTNPRNELAAEVVRTINELPPEQQAAVLGIARTLKK